MFVVLQEIDVLVSCFHPWNTWCNWLTSCKLCGTLFICTMLVVLEEIDVLVSCFHPWNTRCNWWTSCKLCGVLYICIMFVVLKEIDVLVNFFHPWSTWCNSWTTCKLCGVLYYGRFTLRRQVKKCEQLTRFTCSDQTTCINQFSTKKHLVYLKFGAIKLW